MLRKSPLLEYWMQRRIARNLVDRIKNKKNEKEEKSGGLTFKNCTNYNGTNNFRQEAKKNWMK